MLFASHLSKEYVSGEGFYYQGRSYRLRLVDGFTEEHDGERSGRIVVRFFRGRFELLRSQQMHGERHFIAWYMVYGQMWLERLVAQWQEHVPSKPHGVQVRRLGYRWGTCTPEGKLLFHWRVALLPKRYAEYVVVHELAHLEEGNHTSAFWDVMERILPDYVQRREWLAQNGIQYDL